MNQPAQRPQFPPWAQAVGWLSGLLTLVFFMALVLLSIVGFTVPAGAKFAVIAVLSVGMGLSATFLGGTASAEGKIPIPGFGTNPVGFGLTGGGATFVVVMLLGFWLYPGDGSAQPDGSGTRPTGSRETPDVDTTVGRQSLEDMVPGIGTWALHMDAFDESASGWPIGAEPARGDDVVRRLLAGRYRWELQLNEPWQYYKLSPQGATVDFYAAVDLVFSVVNGRNASAGLVFAHTGDPESTEIDQYQLHLYSDGKWAVSRARGEENDWQVAPSAPSGVSIDTQQAVRIGVLVEEGLMRFFVNGIHVGDRREPDYRGGQVGLFAGSEMGEVAIEFDNFELRRKPRL